MSVLEHLEPRSVFMWFERLCAIPHGSGNTKAASDWLVSFARERGLSWEQDALYNVLIRKDASPGYEAAPGVILQGHIDMVCEKLPECPLDLARDGLALRVEGDTVYAEGSTLGGDDGVAVAMMLALLDDGALPHPALECLFTTDEEIGMLGAAGLNFALIRARRMINLDSEEEGIFTVGCAGGRLVTLSLPVDREEGAGVPLRLEVSGLTGGHSGGEIHKGRANAVMLLGRLLYRLKRRTDFRLQSVSGGGKDNAIPMSASASLCAADAEAAAALCREMEQALREEYAVTDGGVRVALHPGTPGPVMDAESTERVGRLLLCAPDGVQAMSPDIPGLVQTSLNLGILRTVPDGVEASFCVRSSVESQKWMLTDRLECLAAGLGGGITVSGDYPGWAYRRESPLRDLMTEVFTEQYGHAPVIAAIHAGLECGLFSAYLPGLDCVSIGPELSDIHTPRERLHVASLGRTWALLCETLKRMKGT